MEFKFDLARALSLLCLFATPLVVSADESAEEKKITFEEHIKPIFREHCTACHSESDKASDLALDSYGNTLAGGSSGDVIEEGNASASRLFALVVHAERPFMPPDQDPIPKEQIQLLKTWIEQGMPENSGSKIKRTNNAAAAMLGNVVTGKPEGPPPMPESVFRQPVIETERSSAISAMAASPWAPLIAVGGQQQVSLYHSQSGELLGILPFPEGEPQSLTFTRDGKQLLIAGGEHSKSGCAVLVDIATGERITKVGDELDTVLAADITPDKTRIAIAGPQKIVRIYDSLSGELVVEMKKHTDWIFSLRYSPDGVLLATGDRSNGLIVWEADSGQLYTQLNGHKGAVRALDFRADSNVLASASLDGTVKLWDMFESREIKSWNAHGGGVTAINYAHNGMIATCGRDARAKLWDGNGGLKKEFKGLSEAGLEVAMTGDAAAIAAGDWTGRVQLWPAADPAKTTLIAANPPSIATRLQQANAELAQVQTEFDKLAQVATTATGQKDAEAAKLKTVQDTVQTLAGKRAQTQQQEQQLSQQLGGLDSKIKELEAALAATKKERTGVVESLKTAQQSLTTLAQSEKKAKAEATAHQGNLQKLTEASTQAVAARDAAATRLNTAKAAAEKAAKDQAALDARANELTALAAATAQQVAQVTTEATNAEKARQAQQSQTEAVNKQLADLQAKLAEIQQQVEQITASQSKAQQELATKQESASKLQQQLEAAQAAALEAQEKLELFQKSYQQPVK